MDVLLVTPARTPTRISNLTTLFTEGRSASTIRAYRADLEDFNRFMGAENAVEALIAADAGTANEIAIRYRNELLNRGLKPATVNRRIATLRSVVAFARTLGFCSWELAVRGVKAQPYRDTRGPGVDGVRKMLLNLARRGDAEPVRDTPL